ncbi:MAG: hypothetical protein ACRDST_23740, partial [Pseudonocardiaceae bacterium]
LAINHLEHQRKRSLYGEALDLLAPGGVFANSPSGAATATGPQSTLTWTVCPGQSRGAASGNRTPDLLITRGPHPD